MPFRSNKIPFKINKLKKVAAGYVSYLTGMPASAQAKRGTTGPKTGEASVI
jgi:hypothetical protein